MGQRRELDLERALSISIHGAALRLVDQDGATLDAVAHLRGLAGDRIDLLAREAGGMIGGYLGHPLSNPLSLPAAYLLILASIGTEHTRILAGAMSPDATLAAPLIRCNAARAIRPE